MAVMTPLKPAPMTAIRQPSRATANSPGYLFRRRRSGRVGEHPGSARPDQDLEPWPQVQLALPYPRQLGLDRFAQALDLQFNPYDRAERAEVEHLGSSAFVAPSAQDDVDVLRPDIGLPAPQQLDRARRL